MDSRYFFGTWNLSFSGVGAGQKNTELRPAKVDQKMFNFANFRPIVLKRIERGLKWVESTFYSFQRP